MHDVPWLCNNYRSYGNEGFVLAPSWESEAWSWSIVSWDDKTNAMEYGPDNSIPSGTWNHLVYVLDPG
ncbi:MAG: hypothetical protein J6T79_03665, partial [Verrucomicrobia bacterium]|nr:hypothetical protein [Verrucomicrobiota bacterium]